MDPKLVEARETLLECADVLRHQLNLLNAEIRGDSGFIHIWQGPEMSATPPPSLVISSERDYLAWVVTEMDYTADDQGRHETPMAPGVFEVSPQTLQSIVDTNAAKIAFKQAGLAMRNYLIKNRMAPEQASEILRRHGHARINRRQAYRTICTSTERISKIKSGWYRHARVKKKTRDELLAYMGRKLSEAKYQRAKKQVEEISDPTFALVQEVEEPRPRTHIQNTTGQWTQFQSPLPIAVLRGTVEDWSIYSGIPEKREAPTRRPRRGRSVIDDTPFFPELMVHRYVDRDRARQ